MLLGQPVADLGALLGRRLAGILVGLDDEVRLRRFGPVRPDLVDRVALRPRPARRRALASASFAFFTQSRVCSHGIVADPRALGRMLLEPLRRAGLGHRLVAPLVGADLLADLQRVAAVDEDRRFLRQHHRRAGRALEAGQPGEPLGVAADIFAHMLVGQRDDEAVELVGLELLAKGGEAVGITGHGLTPLAFS